jgi:hypothetical protein
MTRTIQYWLLWALWDRSETDAAIIYVGG